VGSPHVKVGHYQDLTPKALLLYVAGLFLCLKYLSLGVSR
jgi:hypothetical protein